MLWQQEVNNDNKLVATARHAEYLLYRRPCHSARARVGYGAMHVMRRKKGVQLTKSEMGNIKQDKADEATEEMEVLAERQKIKGLVDEADSQIQMILTNRVRALNASTECAEHMPTVPPRKAHPRCALELVVYIPTGNTR